VVPLWAEGIPETLASNNPFARVAIDAGIRFWAYMTSTVGIVALVALVVGFGMPPTQRAWQTFAALAELAIVAMTLLYFRPTLIRLFVDHGVGLSTAALAATVDRWVTLNRVRILVSFIAWCAALRALTLV
jgi:hypothetical protein